MRDFEETPYQKFAEPYIEGNTMTFGTTTTEWITSDTVQEVKR